MEGLDFNWLMEYRVSIIHGIITTIYLTGIGGSFGVALGLSCAVGRLYGPIPLKFLILCYIELIRNSPFFIQLLFIYLGLPALGITLPGYMVAGVAMVINLGAYSAEILRAGIQATPRGLIEAGISLALTPTQVFLSVILRPSFARVWPALSSQIVLEMLGSAVVSQIAVEDLTYIANFIQSRNFRAFETYIASTLIYLLLAVFLRQALSLLGWALSIKKMAQ